MDDALFATLATSGTRLLKSPTPPPPGTLRAGDMAILGDGWGTAPATAALQEAGVHVRVCRHWGEVERLEERRGHPVVVPDYTTMIRCDRVAPPGEMRDPGLVASSKAAFAVTWDALSTDLSTDIPYEAAATHLPPDFLPYLPYPTLNPAQVEAAATLRLGKPVLIVAPTGAGKTVMGMIAALQEIVGRGGKAAWLVPQRSLTAELDRDLDLWRRAGIKVVALSGETTTDSRAAKDADLWVATTEKFEALCRATSMRETISAIGTLIVDEIHLLGDPSRGPILETLLARIRGTDSPVRLVGLSATAANADEVAAWLGADMLQIAWRPTRQVAQILTIPDGDRHQEAVWRDELATALTTEITAHGGPVIIFCGTRPNVRRAAVAVSRTRTGNPRTVDLDNTDDVQTFCADASVGLHYSDWPDRRTAEEAFRAGRSDVLVATSTLAAGVNTPARAVIIRDTHIGLEPMSVAMVQQMFGRAGRAGHEREGFAYLIATASEAGEWRKKLAAGYTINSGISDQVEDHLLGEIVQRHIATRREAERWWASTFACAQGNQSLIPVGRALDLLNDGGFIKLTATAGGDHDMGATPLGEVTSKMMVSVRDALGILAALNRWETPTTPAKAEAIVIESIAYNTAVFDAAPDAGDQAAAVQRVVAAQGHTERLGALRNERPFGLSRARAAGPIVAHAGMLLAARSPSAFLARGQRVAGVKRTLFGPALYDSPRLLGWLGALGPLGVTAPWAPIVAADLARRIRWHRLRPRRGHGRLLALAERCLPANTTDKALPPLWAALMDRSTRAPEDWPWAGDEQPPGTQISEKDHHALLRARLIFTTDGGQLSVSPGAAVFTTQGKAWSVADNTGPITIGRALAVAYTRTDYQGNGWLNEFCSGGST